DGDGDLDIIAVATQPYWLENNGNATSFTRHNLDTAIALESPTSPFAVGDVDEDGNVDFVYLADSQRLVTISNVLSPVVTVEEVTLDATRVQLQLGDVDGNGDIEPVIESAVVGTTRRVFLDLDGDDLQDVVIIRQTTIEVHERVADGIGFEFKQEIQLPSTLGLLSVSTGDFNGDGLTDLAITCVVGGGGEGKELYASLQEPNGVFTTASTRVRLPFTQFRGSVIGDIEGVGHDSVVVIRPDGGFSTENSIEYDLVQPWHDGTWLDALDVDQDGDLDLVTSDFYLYDVDFPTSKASLVWYENLDGDGTFSAANPIAERRASPFNPDAWHTFVDWDHDGLPDIVGYLNNSIYWHENVGTPRPFGESETLKTSTAQLDELLIDDLDRDGLFEIIALHKAGNQILKFGQVLGTTGVANVKTVDLKLTQPVRDLVAADLNGDGYTDLLLIPDNNAARHVLWYMNHGDGSFDDAATIGDAAFDQYHVADLDNDGDADLITIDHGSNSSFRWYLNDGQGNFSAGQNGPTWDTISDTYSLDTGDLDGDGDTDLLISATGGVFWVSNDNGNFTTRQQLWKTDSRPTVSFADVNQDGKLDWLSSGNFDQGGLYWHEQRVVGDVNGDGVFDSTDLVAIFAASEYEDDTEDNSTFFTGDFNGDGEFDSGDLVYAFQAGTYVA
ncbi:MAG: VCBS repeat-containing protein, partial [Planctomycetales bacterium]|nr:VCBS repeat-containing protein [Planctomycetales bacterium]